MRLKWMIACLCFAAATAAVPDAASASGGHDDATALEYRVDTSKLSGFSLLLGNLYNGNKWLFAAVVTVTMAVMGAVIAVVVDFILRRLGLDVKRMAHRE